MYLFTEVEYFIVVVHELIIIGSNNHNKIMCNVLKTLIIF